MVFKKLVTSTLVLASLLSVATVPAFATENHRRENTKVVSATAPLSFVSKVPNLTVTENGGSATINWMSSNESISWSVKPSFFGPYYYDLNVTVVRMDGSWAYDQDYNGLSIGGTHSDITRSLGQLAPGRYYATLTGRCIFDPGYADVAPGCTIPIDIY